MAANRKLLLAAVGATKWLSDIESTPCASVLQNGWVEFKYNLCVGVIQNGWVTLSPSYVLVLYKMGG